MAWLLNSTGICVLFVTQYYVAFLLRKVGMPVQLVVLPLHEGGGVGEPGYCVNWIPAGHLYTNTVTSEGTTFSKKRNTEGFDFEALESERKIKSIGK